MHVLMGAARKTGGTLHLHGKEVNFHLPSDGMKAGIALIPEDRKSQGFFIDKPIYWNISISTIDKLAKYSVVDKKQEWALAEKYRDLLQIKTPYLDLPANGLSGGNQQKVLISKWFCCNPEVIIFDEPTRGIDVGAKAEIYKVMRQLADDGKVILMVSSELPEIIAVCDRIAVFCEGRLTQILTNRDDMSEEEIMAWALPQE